MSVYRENVLEIIDNWNGYPLQIPCSEINADGERDPNVKPAINAGIVELKCFINNTCPFYESGYKEDNLVFNDRTVERIWPWVPDDLVNAITVTKNLEGLHFAPRWVFRHNYIYQKFNFENDTIGEAPIDGLFDDFNTNYREISHIHPAASSLTVAGVDETRYKAEQSWVVVKSIFDTACIPSGTEECEAQAKWTYLGKKPSNSDMTERDVAHDYNANYYQAYLDSWDNTKVPPSLKTTSPVDGIGPPHTEELRINKHVVQMPVVSSVLDDQNRGVHWRLIKRTPLFKGEDFFIRFYKQAKDNTVTVYSKDPIPFPDEFKRYWSLDITRNDKLPLVPRYEIAYVDGVEGLFRKRNFAVSPPTQKDKKEGQKEDNKKFDFHDQAYYIIELGMGSETDNYFIIITERANPIFVNFVPANSRSNSGATSPGDLPIVSKRLGDPAPISGASLMSADWFDVTVRNHLGSLVIQFRGKGIEVDPWVIKRWDWVPDYDPVSQERFLKDKVRQLFVPRGQMSIMGGNIKCGFMFGPLQYAAKQLTMIYPPREQIMEAEDMDLAFTYGDPVEIPARSMSGAFHSNPFFLPSQGEHDILFSSTDIYLQELDKHVIPVGEARVNQSLCTQDTQFYQNYYESDDGLRFSGCRDYRYGGFFYGETVRDFPDEIAHNQSKYVKTSNLVVKKYRYLNDPKTKQQAFDILIGMMTGDHIFTDQHWNGSSPPELLCARDSSDLSIHTDFDDEQWFVESCKTPILASLRLISHESETMRWDDGSTVDSGVHPNPIEGVSPYFLDVSDHVMTFSDSWSTSSFSEMEHTGTLNFYLNRTLSIDSNVTDALLALQNKTFYVEVWAGYKDICPDGYSSYSRQNNMFKLFTGLCHGGNVDYQYGKNIMSCKVEDYTAVLKGIRFFNSPWFDGVKDINCIREILQMASFRDIGKYDPGSLIKYLSDNANNGYSGVFYHHFDGRLFKMESYALPSGYNRFDQPSFKFNDGDPYMDAISKIAVRAGKIFFFDQFGIAHYENFQDIVESDYMGEVPLAPLHKFTTNPEIYPGQLVFNKLERNYDVQGMFNHIKIMSNTPDFYLLIGDDLNWSSMSNPESEGFIGYLKTYYQQEGIFGSEEAVKNTIKKYSVVFRPAICHKFETYGVPLRANDIIQINGENTRVIKINHNMNAEKNEWWMEVETEKYQTIQASRSEL